MHNFWISVNYLVSCNFYWVYFRNFANIISAQVNKHIMLSKFFFVTKQIFFKGIISSFCFSSWSWACNRICWKSAVFKPYKSFRWCAYNFVSVTHHINHIRRRVSNTQNPVSIYQIALIFCFKTSWNNTLKNISVVNILFCFFNHMTKFFFCHIWLKLYIFIWFCFWQGGLLGNNRNYIFNIVTSFFILSLWVICFHINYNAYFLCKVVISNNLVKKH